MSIGRPPKDKQSPGDWNETLTLEDWIRKCAREGYPEIARALMQTMSEQKRAHYRAIWKEELRRLKGD